MPSAIDAWRKWVSISQEAEGSAKALKNTQLVSNREIEWSSLPFELHLVLALE